MENLSNHTCYIHNSPCNRTARQSDAIAVKPDYLGHVIQVVENILASFFRFDCGFILMLFR